jgi:epoxyqueuosine reductase
MKAVRVPFIDSVAVNDRVNDPTGWNHTEGLCVKLKSLCHDAGFPMFGIVKATDAPGFERFCQWLDQGYHATMMYLPGRKEAYRHPTGVLEGCQTVIMLGLPYESHPDTTPSKRHPETTRHTNRQSARIGHYASGQEDYHNVIRRKLNQIIAQIEPSVPPSRWRGVVDTAPLLERDFAQLAGLGWVGKNTLVMNRTWGSYFFLAALLTDLQLDSEPDTATDHCGSCTACLDACPTDAFPQAYVLDASRCISYLTIEHRGSIEPELRPLMGDWIFGCDVCQTVCPWNRKRLDDVLGVFRSHAHEEKTSLEHWLTIDESEFRDRYRHTPFLRTKLPGMQRNAMIAAANQKRMDLLPKIEPFQSSENTVLAETASWAVKCLKG